MGLETTIPPPRRPDLLVRPLGEDGSHVVKDPRTAVFFNLGVHEAFIFNKLDGQHGVARICADFQDRFGEPLTPEDLDQFLELAKAHDFLVLPLPVRRQMDASGREVLVPVAAPPPPPPEAQRSPNRDPLAEQSIFFWRRRFFDPDRLFTWLEPKVRFLWTRTFLVVSLLGIVAAVGVITANGAMLLKHIPQVVRWETWLLAWSSLVVVTLLHEFAHGLTCKRHGGDVHEIGFLLMFFMPCFYCDVSDAWLLKEKTKRLWVTLAGAYCDLCLWALAVFVWRLAQPATTLHYLAWVVLSVCGIRVFLNFNPLIKLDGYYLLSDWMEIPNLRQRSWNYFGATVRWALWGADRPKAEPRGRLLLAFGLAGWLFTLAYLAVFLAALASFLGTRWGLVGIVVVLFWAGLLLRGLLTNIAGGEVWQMFLFRRKRTLVWLGLLGIGVPLLFILPMEDRASGSFRVRPAQRAEVRAPVSGFLRVVRADEGAHVVAEAPLLTLEVPDLDSRLAQKQAEVRETQAKLRLLEAGPRREEVNEQKQRVERARRWRDLAREDLQKKKEVFKQDVLRLSEQIAQTQTENSFAQGFLDRAKKLLDKQALSKEKYREAEKVVLVSLAQLEQVQAQKRAREAQGTLEDEAELARRDKELADAQAALTLLEAGSRPEEIDAEKARLARLQEELRYLNHLRQKVEVRSPLGGVIITPYLREKIGQFFKEGDLLCEVEDPSRLEGEILIEEQDISRVQLGQAVDLKARALPFQTFTTQVGRIAPCATKADKGEVQGTVTIACPLYEAPEELRPGMTGHARIACGRRAVASVLATRLMRYLRTEFWW